MTLEVMSCILDTTFRRNVDHASKQCIQLRGVNPHGKGVANCLTEELRKRPLSSNKILKLLKGVVSENY